jgi:hypothetical protein
MLTRIEALEAGTDRPKSSHKADAAAVVRLAERGIDKAERARLQGLATQATSLAPTAAPVDDSKHQAARLAVYLWHREWSKIARAVITKRAYLISLELAKRKSAKKEAKAAPAAPPAVVAPAKTEP